MGSARHLAYSLQAERSVVLMEPMKQGPAAHEETERNLHRVLDRER